MLICSISQRSRRAAIAADVAETAIAVDATTIGNIVFATLVDDPASVGEIVDAYLGEIMVEAASADTVLDANIPATYAADVAEAATAADTPSVSGEAAAFLARTSGLDATHTNAYTALIDGLVADGVWSKFDVLYIYATQNSTTALLNLVSATYSGTALNSPTFTADRGYTGVSGSTTVFVSTGFNPIAASSPQYTVNSAHFAAWSATNAAAESHPMLGSVVSTAVECTLYPRFTDGKCYFRSNDNGALAGVTTATSQGHYIANRSSSTDVQGYKNGSSVLSTTDTAVTPANQPFYACGARSNTGAAFGSAHQVAMASIGSSLSSTDATNFYNRLRTYMTAVGVP